MTQAATKEPETRTTGNGQTSSSEEKDQLIQVSTKAQEQIRRLIETENPGPNQGLRVGVVGGGCSGFSYKIEFSDKREKDNVLSYDGFDVFLDPKSAIYLKGCILDFRDGLDGKGFVFQNPNASNTCGCGESFSI